jgi:hypothetical protein
VIEIPAGQRRVGGEQVHHLHQQSVQLLAVPTGFFPPVVALKTAGVLNFPYSGSAAVYPACRP